MCYTVLVTTKACEKQHKLEMEVCYRQCEAVANAASDSGTWEMLCPVDNRRYKHFDVENEPEVAYEEDDCKICAILTEYKYFELMENQEDLKAVEAEVSMIRQQFVGGTPPPEVARQHYLYLGDLKAKRAELEKKINTLQSKSNETAAVMAAKQKEVQETMKIQAIMAFGQGITSESPIPIWYGGSTTQETKSIPEHPKDFPPMEFFGSGNFWHGIKYLDMVDEEPARDDDETLPDDSEEEIVEVADA